MAQTFPFQNSGLKPEHGKIGPKLSRADLALCSSVSRTGACDSII